MKVFFAFTLLEIDRVPKDLAMQLCHFPNFAGFSRLGHILAPGSVWEILVSDIYESTFMQSITSVKNVKASDIQ